MKTPYDVILKPGCHQPHLISPRLYFLYQLFHAGEKAYEFAEIIPMETSVDLDGFISRNVREKFLHGDLERLAESLQQDFRVFLTAF